MHNREENAKNDMELKPIIIFDGVCNLCNATVNFIIQRDKSCKLQFTPVQSQASIYLQKKYSINLFEMETIVLIKNGVVYTKSDAVIQIAKYLDGRWKFIFFIKFFPKFLRDRVYSMIATNRYNWFGKKKSCMVPSENIKNRFLI